MASNEAEVLDPAATVEKLKKFASERVLNRRHFIAALGVAGVAAGTELASSGPTAFAQQPKPNGYAQVDVINLLLNVKYLKATLYSYITQGADLPGSSKVTLGTGGVFNAPAKITFTTTGSATAQQITDLFNEMYYDELNQLIALRALQGVAAANRPTINLLGTGPSGSVTGLSATTTMTQAQAISLAQYLEDLSVTAFAGATIYLTGAALELVTQALASDAFHSGAIRLLSIQTGAGYIYTGSANFSFTAAALAGSSVMYAFLDPAAPVAVGYQISAGATIAIAADTNSNGGSGTIAYIGAASAPALSGAANVTAVGTIPSSYASGYTTSSSAHHLNVLTDVPAAIAQTWAPGMPAFDSGKYFPNPGTYIVSITPNSPATTYTVEFSESSGGHTPGAISVGTTPITLSAPFQNAGGVTASTIGVVNADSNNVVPADPGTGVATKGPFINPPGASSSPLNQGFFDTAGTAAASGSNPAGSAFTRTFQQVLAILYGYTPGTTVSTQNYEGGYFPVGVSGNINSAT
jgi:hypothetical protein